MIDKLIQEILQLLLICLQLKVSEPGRHLTKEMAVFTLYKMDKQMVKINSLITKVTKQFDPRYEIYGQIRKEEVK